MSYNEFLRFCSLFLSCTFLPPDAKSEPMPKMPALFFGHGSPMNIVWENDFTHMLEETAFSIPKPKAILIISAHWLENATLLSSADEADTIYDFGGFPQELYEVNYSVKGSPFLADKLQLPTTHRGIDHGAWSLLKHMYPNADILTMQMSINKNLSLKEHFELGQRLAALRNEGVLIIGSGNVTHNLRTVDFHNVDAPPEPYALKFDTYVKQAIENRDFDALLHPERSGVELSMVHPTMEHYIPLLYIAGIASREERSAFIYEAFQNASLSMRSWQVG